MFQRAAVLYLYASVSGFLQMQSSLSKKLCFSDKLKRTGVKSVRFLLYSSVTTRFCV